ncbi:GcvL: dihydrolipoyl dehydrogenase (E3 component of 2-oxoglutarate dehydrogenase complex) [Desulfosarcina variabilis str. Montpellier]|uniref:dihydrolipoyl dehydrogenase n=1 Tax=Desulfosarcina variabilis TaxID=2300 RepID=UPI003AFB7306
MTTKITILGAGPGGYIAAIRAAQLGAEVTVIEKENVGGTCLNWGCIPSKIMITTADMLERFHQAKAFGIALEGTVKADMQQLMARKQSVIQSQSKGILGLFSHHKIQYIKGTATIDGPNRVRVTQPDGEQNQVSWDKLILATGTRPLEIPSFPFDGETILSSNHALSLTQVPKSVMIVGGGVIGCEFAFILSSLGAQVTVVEALDRLLPLPSVDADCSKVLQREMKKRKIKFLVNRTAQTVEAGDGGLNVTIGPSPFMEAPSEKDKQPVTAQVEKMLVCIGRQPNTADLGLDTIGLEPDKRGWITVNDRMETAVSGVYAIGDVLGPEKIMLAHVASTEGQVAAENAMGAKREMDYQVVPGAIFTTPEVANVGLSEAQARDKGVDVRADSVLFRTLGKAQVIGEIAGQAKIVSEKDSGKILGVHIVGPHATDLIAEAALAMQMGGSVTDVAATIHAHPTLAEIMLEVSCKALDRSLHG